MTSVLAFVAARCEATQHGLSHLYCILFCQILTNYQTQQTTNNDKLLDDGTGRDPLEVHNFGKAANYLFRPCSNEDGTPDEECDIIFDQPIEISEEDRATIDAIKNKKQPQRTLVEA
jgi:hypothetical protein